VGGGAARARTADDGGAARARRARLPACHERGGGGRARGCPSRPVLGRGRRARPARSPRTRGRRVVAARARGCPGRARRPGAVREGSAEPRPTRGEALVALADATLAAAEARSGGDRYQVVVHVDAAALTGSDEESGASVLEDGPPVAAETARRLACDASLVA